MDVVDEARHNYDSLADYAKNVRLSSLLAMCRMVQGDSVVPDSISGLDKEDDSHRSRVFSRVRSQEQGVLRTTERLRGRMEVEEKRVAQYLVEIHKKFSTSFACLIFVLIGAPLGIMARKGGIGTGILYSLAFFVIYWICLIGGENLADRLIISPELAMWASNIIIGAFGIFITVAMVRDRFSGDSKFFRAVRAVGGFFKKFTKRFG